MGFNGGQALIAILALAVGGLALRKLTKPKKKRDSGSNSRTDHGSGEDNETFDPLGIEQKGSKPAYQYDVFLSFCGGDTRLNFTDNLYHRMKGVGIRVFLDSEELEDGKRISEVLKAVDESQIYIPIFSQKFASRPWCLRELVRMVKCHLESDGKREIIPIFYDVKADDVKLRTNLYKNDILKQKKYFQSEELEQWTEALKEVGRMMGRELIGKRLGEEIESIVNTVLRKLGKHVDVPRDLVEDYHQIKAIIEKLDLNSGGVRFVGIYGIGGIGKTTLVKVVFKKLCSNFDRVSFLDDVQQSLEDGHDGLVTLQKKLLTSVGSSSQADQIQDTGDGMHRIKAECKNQKVLIVLDNLDKKYQLEKLAGNSNWFGYGSRIIITTRDQSILMTEVESSYEEDQNQPKGILTYEVQAMELGLALKLFCKHAFKRESVREGYDHLVEEIVRRVDMLPLAIEVIGSTLYCKGLALKQHFDKRKLWEDMLKKLDEGPFKDVRNALMISYRGLEKNEKEVFLDIACFFTNEDSTFPIIMWDDCTYYPTDAISVLLLQSLIKIGEDKKFWMHDQVRDLGRYIIHEEYPCEEKPYKFSRVWTQEDAVKLTKENERNQKVEALSLTSDGCSHNITSEELAALPNLRFLRVKGSDFCGNFENLLSKLKWLSWQTRQMTFHANNFHFSDLVVLDLSGSNIEDGWGGWSHMKMNKLKVLDLTGCMQLKKTPKFFNFTTLEKLILAQCVNLTTIDSSIDKLKLLETLNIKGCKSLAELPTEVGSLQALTEITMPRNFQPLNLPETFGNLTSLLSLVLDEHPGITRLPGSIGGLTNLKRLSLCGCVGIKELPPSVGDLFNLVELDISRSRIVELPDSIGKLQKLEVIKISYTKVRKFPHTIVGMKELKELHAHRCSDLTDENLEEIKKLSHLRILDLSYTRVSRFPTVLSCLSRLQTLEMSSSHLPQVLDLPPSLTHLHMQAHHFPFIPNLSSLVNLDYLELSRLIVSEEEPDSTWENESPEKQLIHPLPYDLSVLKCRGISLLPPYSNLKNLSVLCVIGYPLSHFSISEDLKDLTELQVSKCRLLMEIPGLSHLKKLQRLNLNRLKSLIEINGLSELESLMDFRISHCDRIKSLPNLSKLEKLQYIELEACPKIWKIEGIKGLESLMLGNHRRIVLERLLDDSGSSWLSRIVPKCQVFLSVSGPDTPYGIVDFLYKNLVREHIPIFRDDDDLSSRDEIGKELLLALEDSHIYILFLSKNYVSSWWCLRELAHIVKCASNSYVEKRILPVFYNVEVDDVKLESNLYKCALDQHRREFGGEVEEWETALRKVAGMQGFDLKTKSYEELVEAIVEEVLHELRRKPLPNCFIEDHHHIKAVIEKLDVDSGGVRFIVIHGMGGVGKTALARIVYNKLSPQFDCCSFLHNFEELCKRYGVVDIQKKLLSSLGVSSLADQILDADHGRKWIKSVCKTKKVLIVLDNLNEKIELQCLAGNSDWFGWGSRIIITTRYRSILKTKVESPNEEVREILAHELNEMDSGQALQLLCKQAFSRDSPIEGYDRLAKEIVRRVGMLPLAVAVTGSSLYYKGLVLGQQSDKIELWEDILEQLDEHLLEEVGDALKRSYDRLSIRQKIIFLDIACFFTNDDRKYPMIMWDSCHLCPNKAINVLVEWSLIKIGDDNKFWMHDQLRDLGRHIIQEKYLCRVWIEEDAVKLLEKKEKEWSVGVQGLSLTSCSRNFEAEELAALPYIKFLRVKGSNFSGDFKNVLPELRWLSWQTCPTTFHAINFHFSHLVVLDLSYSDIEDDWGGWCQMKLKNLKVLDLTDCRKLKRTPDFSNLKTLERLILVRCVKLTTIDSSIGKLTCLRILNMEGCSSLGELPTEIGSLQLEEVIMPPKLTGTRTS